MEGDDPSQSSPVFGSSGEVVRQFVEHWGMMARSWGINATMGELFALLYITGTDWTADALREWLRVSRGNVSMNLRELIAWGVVHKVHRQGERREFYRAESNVWTLFRRILGERKRRELDPTLIVLERTVEMIRHDPLRPGIEERIATLRQFFGMIDVLATRLLTLDAQDLDELGQLLGPADSSSSNV
jgi:DNA-binding transcriptional regulator GbsR (MarR family)